MNKYAYIKVVNNINRFINKCKKNNIELYDIIYLNQNEIIVKIIKQEYELIQQYNYYSIITVYKKTGIDYIKERIIELKYIIIVFLIGIISMYFVSNVILKIDVIHSNKQIRNLMYGELNKYGIKKYSIKKNFNELETIKNKILTNNKDKIEWISITNNGMKYIIRVEERIIDNIKKDNDYCNIISTKDALITKIYSSSGETLINVNDLVKKEDVLISGKISLEGDIKGFICSNGTIYGNVWYDTNITIKRKYYQKIFTNKKRLNFKVKNKVLRSNKYNLYEKDYIIKNRLFSIYKEKEYILKEYKYTDDEAIKYGINKIEDNINTKLGNNGQVIKSKIIEKHINKDSISVKLFVVTNEIISKQVILDINKEEDE